MKEIKVLLINPPRWNGIPVIREERCEITERYSVLPPYSLLQIGSMLKKEGINVKLIDANGFNKTYKELEDEIKNIDYDVLIFRFTPTTFENDLRTAKLSKKLHNALVVGICFTLGSVAEDVMKDKDAGCMDIYVKHEYENVIPELIRNLRDSGDLSKVKGIAYRKKGCTNGDIFVNKDAEPGEYYDLMPDYSLLPNLKPYFINTSHGKPFSIIYTSKGCPFQCKYCTVAGTKLKIRTAENLMKEIRFLKQEYGIKTISFFDETFTIDRNRVEKICRQIRPLGITWYCNTRASLIDFKLLRMMRNAGCKGISFGIESGCQKILDNVSKGIKVKEQEDAIKSAKKAGIKVFCSFIIGLPGETRETFRETLSLIKRTLPTSAQFNIAVPYPGTELYNYAEKRGLLKGNFNWKKLYQHNALVSLCGLSLPELGSMRKKAYKSLYFNPRWIMQNIFHVLKNPEDFALGFKYFVKIMKNYFVHRMQHTH